MDLTRKRWLILVAACVINLCLGSIYVWSVFASSMSEYFSVLHNTTITSGELAIVYTIANSVGPITMISGGVINDKIGPKLVILIGGILVGLGMIITGFATSVNFMIVSYGLIFGLGLGMTYGATVSTCMKFFPDKRGLIGGITTAIYGLGSVILPPIVTRIVDATDAPTAFKAIGVVFLILITLSSLVMQQCPKGFVPKGFTPPQMGGGRLGKKEYSWKDMLGTPVFYVMLLLFTCGAFSGMMIISQASAVAIHIGEMSLASAATVVSMLAGFNAFGRILAGFISDRIGRINTLSLTCVFAVGALTCLYFSSTNSMALFYVGIAVVGLCFGSFMGVYPGFTADRFGVKNNSVNYGIMFIGVALAGYFGPTVMRSIFATNESYSQAFLIAATFNIVGLVLTFIYKVLNKKEAN